MKTRKEQSARHWMLEDRERQGAEQGAARKCDLVNGNAMLIYREAGWEYHRDGWEDTDHLSTFRETVQLF